MGLGSGNGLGATHDVLDKRERGSAGIADSRYPPCLGTAQEIMQFGAAIEIGLSAAVAWIHTNRLV